MRNPIKPLSKKTDKFLSMSFFGISIGLFLVVILVMMLFGAKITFLNSRLSKYTWWLKLTGQTVPTPPAA